MTVPELTPSANLRLTEVSPGLGRKDTKYSMYHFLDRENLPWNNPTLLRISPKRVLPAPNRLDQIAMTSKFYHKILILMEHSGQVLYHIL
ncbi:hypothetical protein HanOQP8_Chr08g0296711 [Helianthus annuus]|nr:hypothetical protein HanHA89_Chr08g0308731 [Helianthus annuus]KAJ0720093.1 hypothetical protein HanLR1_Chr08g0289221 [Helianthus annuus]KAJ0723319.1 hypothetical protein HanOQP8_Chr08g0296711 [Helianthus annuus]